MAQPQIQIYNGVAYRRYANSETGLFDTQYFVCGPAYAEQMGTCLLHRIVWQTERGPIPEGMDIHHKDHNKANNGIENLELQVEADHARYHMQRRLADGGDLAATLNAWRKSEQGQTVLRENIEKCRQNTPFRQFACAHCGSTVTTQHPRKAICDAEECQLKSSRRAEKEKQCVVCGVTIFVKSHSTKEVKTCGYACGWALRKRKSLLSNS